MDCLSVSDGSFILCWPFPCSYANTCLISSMQPLTSKGRVVAGFLSLLMRLGIHEKRSGGVQWILSSSGLLCSLTIKSS